MNVELSDYQVATLLALVRREARWEGYGSAWFTDNRPCWPPKLKRLEVIARKLRLAREANSGT